MKKIIAKRFLSILLCILTITPVMITGVTSSSALYTEVATYIGSKLLQSGGRTIYNLSNTLTDNTDDQKVIKSVTKYCISYEERLTNEVKDLCENILNTLSEMNENITNSTNYISSQINRGFSADVKETFLGENGVWSNDVTEPIKNNGLEEVYNKYIYYFVATALYNNDNLQNNDLYNKICSKWPSLKGKVTEKTVTSAKNDLENAFLKVVDKGANKEQVYTSSIVSHKFATALEELSNNYVHGKGIYDKGKTSVANAAATCAYYYFPFSYQQYNFIKSEIQNQIMVTSVLALAYNEFLANQGEYLAEHYSTSDWCNNIELKHTSSGDNNYIISQTYNDLKKEYLTKWLDVEKQVVKLYNSPIYINASHFNGNYKDIETSLNKYMTEEDSTTVNLKIQNFTNQINYYNDIKEITKKYSLKVSETTTNSKYINSTLKFNRIQTGVNGNIYYILDPNQFSDQNALNMGNMVTRIKRKNFLGIDSTIGDLYEISCDYINLTKPMSDGANTFSCPKDLNNSLSSLFNTPTYSSVYSNTPSNYLASYLPNKPTNTTYLLSSNYNNNFGSKISYMSVHSGDITMSNLYTQAQNSNYLSTDTYDCDDYYLDSSSKYSLILSNNNSDGKYYQNARLSFSDYNAFQYASIEYNDKSYTSEKSIEAGEEITIKFKFNTDTDNFVSLKCQRNNSSKTETVLIDGEDELNCFYNSETGYYEFTTYMPYSDTTFYFESNRDSVNCSIENYNELCKVSEQINKGNERYISGNYVLTSDIECEGQNWIPIGTEEYSFSGTFDGQGHTIKNLNINSNVADGDKNGLFKCLNKKAVVKNIVVSNASVYTNEETVLGSGVIAKQNNGTITNCLVTNSNVKLGNYDYLGGIVGLNNGTIENCGVANTNISRICGGNSSKTMGGIAEVNKGNVKNCYTYNCKFNCGTSRNSPIVSSGNTPLNCYYYTTSTVNKMYGFEKKSEQFNSGEVAYCLNSGITDGTHGWYQSLDNGIAKDAYPVISNNGNNTVYKSTSNGNSYSNSSK